MNSPKDSTPHLPATVALSSHGLTLPPGPARIVTRMAENMLAQASLREQALTSQRLYRVGDYEFREPDHEQIQRWAKMLGMAPEEIVEKLASWRVTKYWVEADRSTIGFEVQGGAIISLAWNFQDCPLTDWAWVAGLRLEQLAVENCPGPALPTLPGCLRELYCGENPLTELDLSPVPGLITLDCWRNPLTELDLRPVPGLTYLNCSSNRLTNLWCNDNQLKTLKLSDKLPHLRRINGQSIK